MTQRLLDAEGAGRYLGNLSERTVRMLAERGDLRPVRIPSLTRDGEAGRRLLFDVKDLDAAVERWKKAAL